MSSVIVPPGWVRKKVGKKIVYITDVPRTRVWNLRDFDRLQENGRYLTVQRHTLNFSTKV